MALRGLVFYTVNEVSDIMQVRVETVLRWIYAKKIKASKLPGSRIWRIREEDIVDFMERGANTRDNFHEDDHEDIKNHHIDIEDEEILEKIETTDSKVDKHSKKSKAVNHRILIKESDVVHMKDGDYVSTDKLLNGNEKITDEFVFDEEQAKKPIESEITLVSIENENVHICDDEEINARIMKRNNIVVED